MNRRREGRPWLLLEGTTDVSHPFFSRRWPGAFCVVLVLLVLSACTGDAPTEEAAAASPTARPTPPPTTAPTTAPSATPSAAVADVRAVNVSGEPNTYRFSVEIASPDLGCEQYADWWEVLSVDGELLYRRILAHSHVDEQPFVRSGGPVPIAPDTVVWVRAHMHPGGYGGVAFKGSVESGFQAADYAPDFALDAAETPPLPEGCAF